MTWFFAPPRPRWWDRFRRGKKLSKDWQDIGYVTEDLPQTRAGDQFAMRGMIPDSYTDIGYLVEEPPMPDNGERYRAWGEVLPEFQMIGLPLTFPKAHFIRLPFEVDPDMLDALSALFSQGVSYLLHEGANLSTIRAQLETDLSDGSWYLTMRGNS